MERFSRILIIIFIITLINLGLNSYLLTKINKIENTNKITTNQNIATTSASPKDTSKPTNNAKNEADSYTLSSDVAIIKAEIRSLRELLGTTRTFEELNSLIKTLEPSE